ncbi:MULTISPECIES: MFS transporter [Brevundimonas]|uniref:MFS transporter n=1 Tax=Brevundimonas TaxID=41275 RepID=UPI00320827FC
MLAFLPVVLDMTILHVAVPTLTLNLKASGAEALWIIDIYPLLMAGLVVPMGVLADRVGARRILLTGLVVFGTASALAAYSTSAAFLIGSRAFLAIGGSMIMPTVLGLIRRTFEDESERAMALGFWGTVGAAGAAVGPLIGGLLLAHFWWGSVFLINVPVMLFVAPACYFLLSKDETVTPGRLPIGQAVMLIIAMIALVYGLKAGIGAKHGPALVLGIFAIGALTLAAFIRIQLRSPSPMLNLALFQRSAILAGIFMALVASGALSGVELTLAQELQYVLTKSPLEAGIYLIPIMTAAAVGGPVAGRLTTAFGLRAVASVSLLLAAAALILLSISDLAEPGFIVPALLASLGLALSIGLTASSIAIMGAVKASEGASAGALEATAYELGAGFGITLFGVFTSVLFSRRLDMPANTPAELAAQASRSIGDTMIVAKQLPPEEAAPLIQAGQAAFNNAHSVILAVAGVLLLALALVVFLLLEHRWDP